MPEAGSIQTPALFPFGAGLSLSQEIEVGRGQAPPASLSVWNHHSLQDFKDIKVRCGRIQPASFLIQKVQIFKHFQLSKPIPSPQCSILSVHGSTWRRIIPLPRW